MASAYTQSQISAYLSHIEIPPKYHLSANPPRDAAFLKALHIHTISTLPYENLSLHYNATHRNSLDPQDLYRKIVENNRGRGGYCMENSIFFNHILRGLGFLVYTAGVRIRLRENGVPGGDYVGWVHIVNIVTIDGQKYMVDVGFGGDGATRPIPLIPNSPVKNLGTQEIQLVRDHIPSQTHRVEDTQLWIYQYRNGEHLPWNSFYAFPDFEFMEADFKIMNWFTGSSPEAHQTYNVIAVKFLRKKLEGEDEVIYGKRMMLNGTVKENLGGKTVIVQECTTEVERVAALRQWFGITLSEEEKVGIIGHVTELKRATANTR
ncbi:arylamine N-acetyltransferase 2 [Amniculicola lignicola CBS 123094]|uniref:Arylamine N-acetyltransferase 2 n=1 Tax=Amniculicola lignicola CBS 123094 TaxID=1392246 RepID=A0A6A5W446_9PLEO|nr:arylamine N-acetyltransferase 2 [Amniculicola lignicola CBS 123094]